MMKPSRRTNAIIAYCLAEAAAKYEIEIIAWCVMSNHYHAVVRDPHARLPAFLERFHKMVAKCMNVHLGRWENFWSSDETCVTYLPTAEDVLERVVYTLTNPVAARLVGRSKAWPGLTSIKYLDGRSTRHERPTAYFSKTRSVMPSVVELKATCPDGDRQRVAWEKLVREAVAERERILEEDRRAKKLPLLGRAAILATSPMSAPEKDQATRRKLRPALACIDPALYRVERKKLRGFRAAYRRVLNEFIGLKGKAQMRVLRKDLEAFPEGTYRMRLWNAKCDPFGPRRPQIRLSRLS
jgi:putative transposase